ncbi:hypothetical protein AXF42_Ash013956 [Apostasia shenzhenica]|uniref:NET2A-D/KIP1-like alpha-helical domain-containing protein n=1 Tax=Apostasia shenzhenica TaxID=1088818 RepID=A0A2I0ASD4_9ASPA|nr:hypothetical protein AXF42_Ash013956 [Apostasia shenzhenica]
MATTALRSCEDTLLCLQENQKRSEFTRLGSRKLLMAKEKLKSFKGGHVYMTISEESEATNLDAVAKNEVANLKQNSIQISPDMYVVELADKINELVNKVITLEITTSSQNAQIESLKLETGELHKHVESLEEEKLSLVEGSSNLSDRVIQTMQLFNRPAARINGPMSSFVARLQGRKSSICTTKSDVAAC